MAREKDDILRKYNEQIIMVDFVMSQNSELKQQLKVMQDEIAEQQRITSGKPNDSEQPLPKDAYDDALQTNQAYIDLLDCKEDLT